MGGLEYLPSHVPSVIGQSSKQPQVHHCCFKAASALQWLPHTTILDCIPIDCIPIDPTSHFKTPVEVNFNLQAACKSFCGACPNYDY